MELEKLQKDAWISFLKFNAPSSYLDEFENNLKDIIESKYSAYEFTFNREKKIISFYIDGEEIIL